MELVADWDSSASEVVDAFPSSQPCTEESEDQDIRSLACLVWDLDPMAWWSRQKSERRGAAECKANLGIASEAWTCDSSGTLEKESRGFRSGKCISRSVPGWERSGGIGVVRTCESRAFPSWWRGSWAVDQD